VIRLELNEFVLWVNYIYSLTGISLDPSKAYLVETRFAPLMRDTGCTSYKTLLDKVQADGSGGLRRKVIGAITTNETSFFRDTAPFDMLRYKIIPDLIDARTKQSGKGKSLTIRIWSAACSTGQEVFSTGIVFKEVLRDLSHFDIRILGTDISDKVVAQASYGKYSKLEIERGLPMEKTNLYFSSDGPDYRVKDEIRSLTTFRTMNLLEPLNFPNKFDIVFCRNVAIYFSDADKRKLFDGISKVMMPDGYLIIGSTESLVGITQAFNSKRHMRSIYYQLHGVR
jgi:chemotaxis protein methyltransferase CheR